MRLRSAQGGVCYHDVMRRRRCAEVPCEGLEMSLTMNDSAAGRTPSVSLLVPIYNVERYLRQCLESARAQTLEDIEVICINDGSTDGSRDIVEEYLADARFRVIDKPNSGYGASMNRGLDEARGRYVGILESDDFLDPAALEEMLRLARSHDADVVKADFYLHWSVPALRDEAFRFVSPSMAGRVMEPLDDLRIFYRKPSIWSALYRADFLKANGIRFLETPGASYQDSGFNFKVWACAHRVILTERAYLHYRQDNEASSVNSPGKAYCVCDEYDEMDRFLRGRPDLPAKLRPVMLKMKYDSYMWNYERLSSELQGGFLARTAQEFKGHLDRGELDLDLFEPWKVEDLRRIVDDPAAYHRRRARLAKLGRAGKALHYLGMGGPGMLAEIARTRKRESL